MSEKKPNVSAVGTAVTTMSSDVELVCSSTNSSGFTIPSGYTIGTPILSGSYTVSSGWSTHIPQDWTNTEWSQDKIALLMKNEDFRKEMKRFMFREDIEKLICENQ